MASKVKTQLVIGGENTAGPAFSKAEAQLNKLSTHAKRAGAFIASALAAGAFSNFIRSSIDAADEARKSAQATGLAVKQYTALQYAAKLAGVGTGELDSGLSRFNRTIDEAANGGKAQVEAFDRIGVSVLDAGGKLKSNQQIFAEVATRFQEMPDGVQKSALAMELFGRSGTKLIPLLNGGAAGLEELRKEAEALGLVIGEDQAAAAEVFNDNLTRLGDVSTGAGNKISADMLPALVELTDLLVEVNKEGEATTVIADVVGGGLKALGTIVLLVANAFGSLGRFIGAAAAAASAAANGEFSQAVDIMRSVGEENSREQGVMLERIKNLWSGAGEAVANSAVEQKKQQDIMKGDLQRSTDDMGEQLKRQVTAAQEALRARVDAERAASAELDKAKKAQLDTEKRYADALAKLRSGSGDPSFGQAQTLKVSARQDLQSGDVDGAKQKAQAALDVLNQLAAAGENTYGFEGIIKELQAIEQGADQINVDRAKNSFDEAKVKAAELKTLIDELKSVTISIDLPAAEIERIKGLMQQLQVVITPTVALPQPGEADSDGYVYVPPLPPPPQFATGGHVRGPGTGTSDSIMARLSNGEYVLRAAAVRQYGTALLDRMNGLQLLTPGFAAGGLVDVVANSAPSLPHLGRLDMSIDGQQTTVYVDQGGALDLKRLAAKFGSTKKG